MPVVLEIDYIDPYDIGSAFRPVEAYGLERARFALEACQMDHFRPEDDIAGAVELHDGPYGPVSGSYLHRDRSLLVRSIEEAQHICVKLRVPFLDFQDIIYDGGFDIVAENILVRSNRLEHIEPGRGA